MTEKDIRQGPHTPSQDIDDFIFSGQADPSISQR